MSDLKRLALELLAKWDAEVNRGTVNSDYSHPAEVADYKARIEAAEPELSATDFEKVPPRRR